MLDWIFEAIIDWVARTVTSLMDAVSGLFLNALGTDMTAMEEYFPFASKAFDIMQWILPCYNDAVARISAEAHSTLMITVSDLRKAGNR